MPQKRRLLVTSALPYANGEIHLGHLVEYLQTDYWCRFQKMRGHKCLYVCADDTHGTPIMIRAQRDGTTPEALIKQSHEEHVRDFADCEIEFDNYFTTHSEINREFCYKLYSSMVANKHLDVRSVKQNYCPKDRMFLPDRFIKGTCPECGALDQYGDSCDKCGATYSSSEVLNPRCAICGSKPVLKSSEHIFFKLNDFKSFLKEWLPTHVPKDTARKLTEWFSEDLHDWDISRDAPYFGFEIPGYKDKYFYVWVDAPVGYMASTKDWCNRHGNDFDEWWNSPDTELYHFIGKDIVRFHCLFWPTMLQNGGFKTPNQVFVHGFLTVNGEKMSKSKGTFISARTYLNHLNPMYLRYYYASKLNSSSDDIDLNFDDFVARVNSDLMGKITNLASRGAQMLTRNLNGRIGELDNAGKALVKKAIEKTQIIAQHYENRDFGKGIVEIRAIADEANRYFDEAQPWLGIKNNPESVRPVLSCILNVFRILAICLKPILPRYTANVEKLFAEEPYKWADALSPLENHQIGKYEYLASKIDEKQIDKIVHDSKSGAQDTNKPSESKEKIMINMDDFVKMELRVAEIVEAETIEGADKLLRLTVNLGDETRNVIAGIKSVYTPESIKGRLIVMVANLEPRKMKFGVSEGMILAAGNSDGGLFLLSPDSGAKPGDRIK
ncbi:MAG: methionine--tRNA ligase [Lentisphaerae bacterium]|nr:methionine--tRNA ligase [Lentisphaerota bacterium]